MTSASFRFLFFALLLFQGHWSSAQSWDEILLRNHAEDEGYELDEQGAESMSDFQQYVDADDGSFEIYLLWNEGEEVWGEDDLLDPNSPHYLDPGIIDLIGKKKPRCKPKSGQILARCCLMYVRLHLEKQGLLPRGSGLGIHAKNAGSALKAYGFRDVTRRYNATNAPINAVLIYKGGASGHAEVRVRNGYYFGPVNKSPATTWKNLKRTLTGIYLKR